MNISQFNTPASCGNNGIALDITSDDEYTDEFLSGDTNIMELPQNVTINN